jgi:hypothetical protein
MNRVRQYLYNLGLGLDQFLNVVLLGDPDESVSGRLGRAILSGKPKWFVPPLVKINDKAWYWIRKEVNHSLNAVEEHETPKEKELWSWHK